MPPPEAVKVAEAPLQMVPSLLVVPEVSVTPMLAEGLAFTVIELPAVAVQPVLVTVTV